MNLFLLGIMLNFNMQKLKCGSKLVTHSNNHLETIRLEINPKKKKLKTNK